MESLSRPPHRRNHSTTANAPYDGVFLSKRGKGKPLRPHDYTEIFSGSSSIPVLDIPGIDDRTGSTESRISVVDYSSIFGGYKSVDAALPYDELIRGSAKRSKPRIPADSASSPQQSSSTQSSGDTRMFSDEASKQSVEGAKTQQVKKSFSQKNERNRDFSNGKTHIAHLHSVPGFTHFVDETPLPPQKLEDHKPMRKLKHEVSRTWSFSGEVEDPKGKPGLRSDQSHLPNLYANTNEVGRRSHFSNVPSSSNHPLNPSDNKDPRLSRVSRFGSEKTASECSLPFFDGEYDENSVAAASAAALKKAIEQAQESIRLAKIIMERKREGNEDSSKTRSSGCMKDFDKKTKSDPATYGSEENNIRGGYEDPVPKFTSIDQNVPFPNQYDTIINCKEEKVQKKDDEAKESAEVITGEDELLASGGSGAERIDIDKMAELEACVENVEVANDHTEGIDVPGSVASTENRTLNSTSAEVVEAAKNTEAPKESAEVIASGDELLASGGSEGEWIDNDKMAELEARVENVEAANNHTEGIDVPGSVASAENKTLNSASAEVVEAAMETEEQGGTSEVLAEMAEKDARVKEDEQKDGPEVIVSLGKGVLYASQRAQEKEKIVNEVGQNSKIQIEQRAIVEEHDINDPAKCEIKSEEYKLLNAEYSTAVEPPLEKFLDESNNLVRNEVGEQEEMEGNSENVYNLEESGHCDRVHGEEDNDTQPEEAQPSFESKEQSKEALSEEITEIEPNVLPEIGMFENNAEAHEPEIDYKKPISAHDEDELNFPEENRNSTSARESAASAVMDAQNSAEVPTKDTTIWDAEEANNTCRGTEKSEEDNGKNELLEDSYKEDVDASDIIFRESQEVGEVELNYIAEEYKKAVNGHKEDDPNPEVVGTSSSIDGGQKAEQLFHLEDIDNSRQFSPEDTSSDDNAGGSDTFPKERSSTDNEMHVTAEDHATEINSEQSDVLSSDKWKVEFDLTGVRQVLEQPSESDEGSASISSFENIYDFSSHESDGCAENAKEETSGKEDTVDELEVSSERGCAKEQSVEVCSELRGNPKEEADKFMETGRTVETNTETNKDDVVGTSGTAEKDAEEFADNLEKEEHQQKIDAIKRREQEKDRIAVERAIREARARAFAEVRERAERAAVEKAAAEVRQRIMAEAQEKASMVKPPAADKASNAAKLRAQRAAVERATAEARERALKKAMSQKSSAETRTKADRNQTENSGNNKLKHSFSSSDLETGTSQESSERRKARVERQQRIMERAEKALAEKYKRDILAQKEQAERNRLSESLDADIKRWAFGKEGNLRALLSTLQYILGPDSSWQPISLTEIITTAAVKKAYRKATLYVHPDKLQQRGASIQQKYICEKVFDLLKAAWNKFSSDER